MMQNSNNNPRIQLLVNGNVVATAGIEDFGVITGVLTWVKRDPAKKPGWSPDWSDEVLDISLGGLRKNEHITWFKQSLKRGDEVTFRILKSGDIDAPIRISKDTPITDAKRHIDNLWSGLKSDTTNDPEAVIVCSDGRFIVFRNSVIAISSEYIQIINDYKIDMPSITIQELFQQVTKLRDFLNQHLD